MSDHGGGHSPKASSNHGGGGGVNVGTGWALVVLCLFISTTVAAIIL